MDQNEPLDGFFEWYVQKYGDAAGGPWLEKIKEAQTALGGGFKEVAVMRNTKEGDWIRLGVPIGIGKSLAREAKGFLLSRSSS